MIYFMQHGLVAQAPNVPNFDPSDVYFQGYLAARAGEQLEKDQDYVGALSKYQQATELFGSVEKFYPEWKADMVKNRKDLTLKALTGVQEKAGERLKKDDAVIAELEGGEKVGVKMINPSKGVKPLNPGVLEVDPLKARRLKDAEAELARLRDEISKAEAASKQSTHQSTIEDLRKQNQALSLQLKAVQKEVSSLRSQMAAAPMEGVMQSLNERIAQLNQEKEVMGMALKTSRGDHNQALSKIEILTADMELMKKQAAELRQKQADTKRDLETERQIANEVVAGQLKQMAQMERVLGEKSKQLEHANKQIAGLTKELEESRAAYSELQEERDGLLRERDHLAALLKLNESGRIEELVAQNVGLAKSLREAKEQVERLNLDNNATKDMIAEANRDLVIAKSQINRLIQGKQEQDKRITELTEKLQQEEALLASGGTDASHEEIEMLREVIRRQLRVQERRRQAKELLVNTVKKMGQEDAQLKDAIEIFDGSELELSQDEQKLIADQNVDGEFLSPTSARDRETVGREMAKLNIELESYNRAARKAYVSNRLHSARELFEMMIDQHPGHIPAICRLGVVQLKLDEPVGALASFQKAIELDKHNPYANRMLGFTYMQLDELDKAEKYLERAIELAPDDAKNYMLMGAICHLLGNIEEAESQFKGAIAADPMPSEPYFNIAMICASQGRIKDAKQYYSKALERGAVPDQALESRIMKLNR
ncbi:MAG: tetratricopeptide repeat protein [Akkermansiaceae bacterium]|jgi:tetratricopeptide (TPR) repeat protein